jgi:hypothetical protein
MKTKLADLFVTSVAALETAEILCTIVSDTGKDMIVLPQAQLPRICPGA